MGARFRVVVAAIAVAALLSGDLLAQRRGGGGRGGGGRGAAMARAGGGGARGASFSRSPSMSRMPSRPAPRQSAPSRPSHNFSNLNRPQGNRQPISRPQVNRPQTNRSPLNRPQAGAPQNRLPGGGAARPQPPSRPPARPGGRPGGPPSRDQLQGFINLPAARPGGRPSTLPSTDRGKIRDGIGQTPGRRPQMPDWFEPGGARPRPENPIANRPNRPGDADRPGRPQRPERPDRPALPDRPVARPPGVRPPGNRPGRPNRPWYPGHPNHGRYAYGYWWRGATVGGLAAWVVSPWGTPVYTTYGDGGSVYYENNTVYVGGEAYGTPEEYYTEAATIAAAAPAVDGEEEAGADDAQWMPLGVFALTAEGVNASTMYLQLAISKEAVLAGTFYNETTGATHAIEGMVDEQSQRAAWRCADGANADIVMETGVYNLTNETTDALVHFGPEETQVWKMVRLDESDRPDSLPDTMTEGATP